MILPIHDEILFLWDSQDSAQIFLDIKHIMEDWDDALVPIVAEMELTTTNWAEKYEVHSVEDFYKEGK
jgi:DNA polymerase I-like protein with 3'-5' exonuclease and polymerase domains